MLPWCVASACIDHVVLQWTGCVRNITAGVIDWCAQLLSGIAVQLLS